MNCIQYGLPTFAVERANQCTAGRGQTKSENTAKCAEQYAFDQQLTDHPPPRRAERRANRHLPLPPQRPAQHHIGHVGAGNQKHEPHRGKHEQENEPNAAAVIVLMESFSVGGRSLSVAGYCMLRRLAMPLSSALAVAIPMPGLSIAKSWSSRLSRFSKFGSGQQRHPKVRIRRKLEALRHHADDGRRLFIHPHRSADHAGELPYRSFHTPYPSRTTGAHPACRLPVKILVPVPGGHAACRRSRTTPAPSGRPVADCRLHPKHHPSLLAPSSDSRGRPARDSRGVPAARSALHRSPCVRLRWLSATSRSPPGTATGLSSTAFTSVKTIVLRPMPIASVATTAAENQRWARIIRTAKRKSFAMTSNYAKKLSEVPRDSVKMFGASGFDINRRRQAPYARKKVALPIVIRVEYISLP